MISITGETLDLLQNFQPNTTVAAGFDGFIDVILKPVCSGGREGIRYFDSIAEFGNYIASKAHKSCSIELRSVVEKFGGNAPIYSSALARLGVETHCIGAMGYPELCDVFRQMDPLCTVYSVCMPGVCQALEFSDGKVMLARNDEIGRLDYPMLAGRVGVERLTEIFGNAGLVTLLNWSELQGSSSVWKGLLREILPRCRAGSPRPMLVDLSDCSRRTQGEMEEMASLLRAFGKTFEVMLSLNRNELEQLGRLREASAAEPVELAKELSAWLHLKYLIVHLSDGCFAIDGGDSLFIPNHPVRHPKILTGGGDHFNAGFSWAYLAGLPLADCLAVANAASGFYVSKGTSPDSSELIQYIRTLSSGTVNAIRR